MEQETRRRIKKTVLIGGSLILIGGVGYFLIKKPSSVKYLSRVTQKHPYPSLSKSVSDSIKILSAPETSSLINTNSIYVREHLRRLPNGWHASNGAIEKALSHGYVLQQGETYVSECVKYL